MKTMKTEDSTIMQKPTRLDAVFFIGVAAGGMGATVAFVFLGILQWAGRH